jgi:serine phosphatase RsbU (regulator of sigma subunit)/anti-sigma regulatory factor (Ser/Thr protein kinase)
MEQEAERQKGGAVDATTPVQLGRLGWWARRRKAQPMASPPADPRARHSAAPALDIAPDDPILAYFASAPGAVEIDKLHLESPALASLRAAGVKMVIPLISQGELVGLLNMGQRLSEQDYSTDDRRLLSDLATQAAPALRVAQLVREQQAEIRTRERLEQELRVARLIQQTLLPKDVPHRAGWQVAAYYQPARAVGGDFYDFLDLDNGKLGLIVGDVTDKGVPAALLMATTRSILRTAAQSGRSPGQVLGRANDLLCPDVPPKMFVTCLYAVLDVETGQLVYANAGHDLPQQRHASGDVSELRARGMPLGLMPGMAYEERETCLEPGDSLLLYSDGIVEAHDPARAMFGFPRLASLMRAHTGSGSLIDYLLADLAQFTGPDWEQEDDVTMVTIERAPVSAGRDDASAPWPSAAAADAAAADAPVLLGEVEVASEPGNERLAMEQVVALLAPVPLSPHQLDRLKTAVAEATMNAMEHGNRYDPQKPVVLRVSASGSRVMVAIRDHGGGRPIPEAPIPDLAAKLAGEQSPRGWGLFLIKHLVDEMHVTSDETHHTIELIVYLEEAHHGQPNA